jgi:ABC-type transport system substrate-binding protein
MKESGPGESVRFDLVRFLVRSRRLGWGALVVSVSLACLIGADASRSRASSAWTLRIAQTGASPIASIGSIDPAQAASFFATQLLWSTCAFLYDYPDAPAPSGGALRPEVATAFPTVRRSGRNYTYTIRVRSGFRYQDGRPVTAADFVYDINRDRDPSLGTLGAAVLRDLVRAAAHGSTIALTRSASESDSRRPRAGARSRCRLPRRPRARRLRPRLQSGRRC